MELKTKVALAAIKGGKEITNKIASTFGIHPGQMRQGIFKLIRAIDKKYPKLLNSRRKMHIAIKKKGFQVSEKKIRKLMKLKAIATRTL